MTVMDATNHRCHRLFTGKWLSDSVGAILKPRDPMVLLAPALFVINLTAALNFVTAAPVDPTCR
jgi:hypothetical protein